MRKMKYHPPTNRRSHRLTLVCATAALLCFAANLWAGPLPLVSLLHPSQSPPFGGNGDSCLPVLSPDGRFVLFASTANNLLVASNGLPLPALVPARFNVFLRDRTNQTTTLVSATLAGTSGGNGDSFPVALSTNGQFALIESSASDLVAGDTNNATDIFLRDLAAGTTWLVSVSTNGLPGNGVSRSAVMTPDGRYIAFVSEASNLVPGDTNRIARIFLRDLQAATTVLVSAGPFSTNAAAVKPASGFDSPELTPDGRYVAFSSTATNLVPGSVPGQRTGGDIYVRDVVAGTNVWASSGMRANLKNVTGLTNGVCYNLALSADGKFVAYQASLLPVSPVSSSSNISFGIILRYSLETGLTDLVHANGTTSILRMENTRNLDLTPDGRLLAFTANTNGVAATTTCVLVWDANSGALTLASGDLGGAVPTNSLSSRPVLTPDGRRVAFLSNAGGLATNSVPGLWQLYLRDLPTATTVLVNAGTNGAACEVTAATVARLSADGNSVAFEATDGSLVANDNNHSLDVFVRDVAAGTNELVSASHPVLTSTSPNGASILSAFSASADGRYIAFASEADNLVSGDTNGFRDIFVRDLATATNWLVSLAADGASANGLSYEPAISGDGRYVAFTSSATNLVTGDTNKATDIFVRDRQAGTTMLASVKYTVASPGNKASYSPALSADGRWLLFRSQATDLASGSFTGAENLFLRDLQTGTTWPLTASGSGTTWPFTASGVGPAMTPDGRFTAFVGGPPLVPSAAYLYVWDALLAARVFTNATIGITNLAISSDGNRLAYVLGSNLRAADRATGADWLVSPLALNSRTQPRFSADGRWLTYARIAGGSNQVYLYDLQSQTEILVSHAINSAVGASGHSDAPEISPDGRFVAYRSLATNIVAGANGAARQIILYDRQTGANSLVSANPATGSAGDDYSVRASFSPDGQVLLVQSWASDLATGDFNRSGDVLAYGFATAVLLPSATPGQGPWITWPYLFSNHYRVQFKSDLSEPVWQTLPGTITNLGVKAFLPDAAPASARKFYRVESF